MTEKDQNKSYVDLASQTYGFFVDAAANANQRTLSYFKSLYEIGSRPYTSTALEATYRENFDRANQIVEVTVEHLQKNAAELATLAEKAAAHGAQWQETVVESTRGAMRTALSNLAYVKDTADQQFVGFTKRVEDLQARTVSAN